MMMFKKFRKTMAGKVILLSGLCYIMYIVTSLVSDGFIAWVTED